MVEKAKWNPLGLPLPRKIVNPKQYHIPGGILVTVPKQGPERCTDGDLYHIPIQFIYSACAEDRWILYNGSGLSQAPAGGDSNGSCYSEHLDSISLFEQINIFPGTWYAGGTQ